VSGGAEVRVQVCERCGHRLFPARLACGRCGGSSLGDEPAGEGAVEGVVDVFRAPGAGDRPRVVLVRLDSGPRLLAGATAAVGPGDRVRVALRDGAIAALPADPGP